MPLERGGWRARFGGECLLRRESSESTSDTSRKRTRLALRGRLMPRRREGRPPPAAPPCIRPCVRSMQIKVYHSPIDLALRAKSPLRESVKICCICDGQTPQWKRLPPPPSRNILQEALRWRHVVRKICLFSIFTVTQVL